MSNQVKSRPRLWRHFDWPLLLIQILLTAFGVMMVHSATLETLGLEDATQRQAIFAVVGIGLMFLCAAFDYRWFSYFWKALYLFILGLLVVVYVAGGARFGSTRWLETGFFLIQPSEIIKILMIVIMARYLANHENQMGNILNLVGAFALLVPPIILVFLQPDLGTAVSIAFIGAIMIFVGGINPLHFALGSLGAAAAAPAIWFSAQDLISTKVPKFQYMVNRLTVFMHPDSNPDEYYNILQGQISIGSGGLLGKGLGQGTQSQLHFLRVRHTDFIFSVIAEELGFAGVLLLLALLGALLMRLMHLAERSSDSFGRLIITGVAAYIFFQSFINIGMNLSLMPVTGIPLPFISYGGSSLLTLMIATGLVQSVIMRRRKLEFD